jgi:hypothetical protein
MAPFIAADLGAERVPVQPRRRHRWLHQAFESTVEDGIMKTNLSCRSNV